MSTTTKYFSWTLALVQLLVLLSAVQVQCDDDIDIKLGRRNVRSLTGEDENPMEVLEKRTLELKDTDFSDEATLTQTIDTKTNSIFYVYDSQQDRINIPIYMTNGTSDKNKAVVILEYHENRRHKCRSKFLNTFVVLKKSSKPSIYWPIIVYTTELPFQLEWDFWDPEGGLNRANKAKLFGWTKCSYSSIVPCKPELQSVLNENKIYPLPLHSYVKTGSDLEIPDYYCDLGHTDEEIEFIGKTIDTIVNSMIILTGTQILYEHEDNSLNETIGQKSTPQDTKTGTEFFGKGNPNAIDVSSEQGVKKLISNGREGISKAAKEFETFIEKIGTLASGLFGMSVPTKSDGSQLAKSLLRGLFEGANTDNKDEKFTNPNPKALLKDDVVQELVDLKRLSEERFEGRLFGFCLLTCSYAPAPEPDDDQPVEDILRIHGEPATKEQLAKGISINITVGDTLVEGALMVGGGIVVGSKFLKGTMEYTEPGEPFKFTVVPRIGGNRPSGPLPPQQQQQNQNQPPPPPVPSGPPPPTPRFLMYFDNSTSPVVIYQEPRGFLFNGLFFPGSVKSFDPLNPSSATYVHINGITYKADPVSPSTPKSDGAMYAPMPPLYSVDVDGKPDLAYYVGSGFLMRNNFAEGKLVEGGVEINNIFHKANRFPPQKPPIFPGLAGAYSLKIQFIPYLAYVVNGGVLIGGEFVPAKFTPSGVVINGELFNGTFISYKELQTNEMYNPVSYSRKDISETSFGQMTGTKSYKSLYDPKTAFIPGISSKIKAPPTSPRGPPPSSQGQGPPRPPSSYGLSPPGQGQPPPTSQSQYVPPKQQAGPPQPSQYGQSLSPSQYQPPGQGQSQYPLPSQYAPAPAPYGQYPSAGPSAYPSDSTGRGSYPYPPAPSGPNSYPYPPAPSGPGSYPYAPAPSGPNSYPYPPAPAGPSSYPYPPAPGQPAYGPAPSQYGQYAPAPAPYSPPGQYPQAGPSSYPYPPAPAGPSSYPPASPGYSYPSPAPDQVSDKATPEQIAMGTPINITLGERVIPVLGVPGGMVLNERYVKGRFEFGSTSGQIKFIPDSNALSSMSQKRAKRSLSADEIQNNVKPLMITDTDLFTHLGWRTIDTRQTQLPNIKMSKKQPFVGIGPCNFVKGAKRKLQSINNNDRKAIAMFFMQVMRTHCQPSQKESLMEVIKFDQLFSSTKPFNWLQIKYNLAVKPKLTIDEFKMFSKAVEVSVLSYTFTNLQPDDEEKLPKNPHLEFLREYVLNYLHFARHKGGRHYVKLTRNLIKTLQTLLTKSLQDFYRFKYCSTCDDELIMFAMEDAVSIIALIEFVFSQTPSNPTNTSNLSHGEHEKRTSDYENWYNEKLPEFKKILGKYIS